MGSFPDGCPGRYRCPRCQNTWPGAGGQLLLCSCAPELTLMNFQPDTDSPLWVVMRDG